MESAPDMDALLDELEEEFVEKKPRPTPVILAPHVPLTQVIEERHRALESAVLSVLPRSSVPLRMEAENDENEADTRLPSLSHDMSQSFGEEADLLERRGQESPSLSHQSPSHSLSEKEESIQADNLSVILQVSSSFTSLHNEEESIPVEKEGKKDDMNESVTIEPFEVAEKTTVLTDHVEGASLQKDEEDFDAALVYLSRFEDASLQALQEPPVESPQETVEECVDDKGEEEGIDESTLNEDAEVEEEKQEEVSQEDLPTADSIVSESLVVDDDEPSEILEIEEEMESPRDAEESAESGQELSLQVAVAEGPPSTPTTDEEEMAVETEVQVESERLEEEEPPSTSEASSEADVEGEGEARAEVEAMSEEDGGRGTRFAAPVIATVHDVGADSDPSRLTESELRLGKAKPFWIPDADCTACMLCSSPFTFINRRHHCRACGRVLCGVCCREKAKLEYLRAEMGDDETKTTARVCQACALTLVRIQDFETRQRSQSLEETPGDSDTPSTSCGRSAPTPILKVRAEEEGESSSTPRSEDRKRSVVFKDGVKPGEASQTENGEEERRTAPRPPKKKSSKKRSTVSRRIAAMRFEEEIASLLPREGPFLAQLPGASDFEVSDGESLKEKLLSRRALRVALKRNLSVLAQLVDLPGEEGEACSVWVLHTDGFAAIGLDEILLVYEHFEEKPVEAVEATEEEMPKEESCSEESEKISDKETLVEDSLEVPFKLLRRIQELFGGVLPPNVSGASTSLRRVSQRLPRLHSSLAEDLEGLPRHLLLYRPFCEPPGLPCPLEAFVVGLFVLDEELPWALASPNRLLLRLGLRASWYPAAVVNARSRSPVFTGDSSQTVLKVFTDFRNWSYRMSMVAGSSIALSDTLTLIRVPRTARQEIAALAKKNSHLVAWQSELNPQADSHLVCDDSDGLFRTQVFTSGPLERKVTGATFVIFDGSLKSTREKIQVNVVEDGVAVRLRGEEMASFAAALEAGRDWEVEDTAMTLRLEWSDDDSEVVDALGRLVSPIDGLYLGNKNQFVVSMEKALSSVCHVSGESETAIRLSGVVVIDSFSMPLEELPKLHTVSELVSREAAALLEPHIAALLSLDVRAVTIRVRVSNETTEYDVAPWLALEEHLEKYRQSLDELVPVLYNLLAYLPAGFCVEMQLSLVRTRSCGTTE